MKSAEEGKERHLRLSLPPSLPSLAAVFDICSSGFWRGARRRRARRAKGTPKRDWLAGRPRVCAQRQEGRAEARPWRPCLGAAVSPWCFPAAASRLACCASWPRGVSVSFLSETWPWPLEEPGGREGRKISRAARGPLGWALCRRPVGGQEPRLRRGRNKAGLMEAGRREGRSGRRLETPGIPGHRGVLGLPACPLLTCQGFCRAARRTHPAPSSGFFLTAPWQRSRAPAGR